MLSLLDDYLGRPSTNLSFHPIAETVISTKKKKKIIFEGGETSLLKKRTLIPQFWTIKGAMRCSTGYIT